MAADGADMISELNDDVLLHILGFLPSARDVARATMPSKRRYYFHDHRHEADITLSRVDSWLRFAERHVKGRFTLEVPLVAPVAARTPRRGEAGTAATSVTDDDEVVVVELPRSTRAEVMSLTLGYATVSVPATGAFRALTDFTLHHAVLDAGSGGDDDLRLGHLLSSPCCPRLRRLCLRHVAGVATLRLDAAAALEELRLVHLPDLQWLDVDAPGLRLLRVGDCSRLPYSDSSAMAISAPRLEVFSCESLVDPERLEFDTARRPSGASRSSGSCRSAAAAAAAARRRTSHEDIIKDVPQLPSVTSLTIKVSSIFDGHAVGASLAKFITKFNNIQYLHIDYSVWIRIRLPSFVTSQRIGKTK
uniref:F-box domain-containing protein n=1 Tax=Oryza nivara TaxID=4536 RepID=A0A0E0I4R6_ORYNI